MDGLPERTYVIVADSMIMPASNRVDKPRRVERFDHLCEPVFGESGSVARLTPTFIVDDLHRNESKCNA
jgi:hypothetical protein